MVKIVHWGGAGGARVSLTLRRESTVVMVDPQTMATFDAAGRLVGAFMNGRTYRRSLSNAVLEKQRGSRPGLAGRARRLLSPDEVEVLENETYGLAGQVQTALHGLSGTPADRAAAHAALDRIVSYSFTRLESEREQFQRVYRPVTILPPDQYLALYLQLTEGCTYDACSFCGFYRDRRFHIKTQAEFAAHLQAVQDFFGPSISLRRSLFLGDANALMIPQAQLLAHLAAIRERFPLLPDGLERPARQAWKAAHPLHFDGLYSFIDAFATQRKSVDDYRALAAAGLRRVYVGLETGDPELLRFLGKPNSPQDVVELVEQLKRAGIGAGIIVLAGAGGDAHAAAHVRQTADLLNGLPLDEHDLVYVSQLLDYPGSDYAQRAQQAGIRSLTDAEVEEQIVQLRARLDFRGRSGRPKVSYYDIREFIY